jgi:hypothetical protein
MNPRTLIRWRNQARYYTPHLVLAGLVGSLLFAVYGVCVVVWRQFA